MAAVTMHSGSLRLARRTSILPIGAVMTDITCVLNLLILFHGFARIDLALAVFEAVMLWWALNARSVQTYRATIAQRFFGHLNEPDSGFAVEVSVGRAVISAFVISICGSVVWLVDQIMILVGGRPFAGRWVGNDADSSYVYRLGTSVSSTENLPISSVGRSAFMGRSAHCQDDLRHVSNVSDPIGKEHGR